MNGSFVPEVKVGMKGIPTAAKSQLWTRIPSPGPTWPSENSDTVWPNAPDLISNGEQFALGLNACDDLLKA
jgi:hypothetical protein